MLLVQPGGWAAALCIYIKWGKGCIFFFWSTAGNSWDSYIPGEMAEESGAKKHRRSGITQSICAAHILQASGAACVTGQRVAARTPSVASASGPSSWRARGGQRRSRELRAPGSKALSSTAHKASTRSPASFPPWAMFGHPLCPQHPVCLQTHSPVTDRAPLQPSGPQEEDPKQELQSCGASPITLKDTTVEPFAAAVLRRGCPQPTKPQQETWRWAGLWRWQEPCSAGGWSRDLLRSPPRTAAVSSALYKSQGTLSAAVHQDTPR